MPRLRTKEREFTLQVSAELLGAHDDVATATATARAPPQPEITWVHAVSPR